MELFAALTCFSALAQETRLAVVRALVRRGPSGLAAGDLADAVGAAPPTLSFHLKELAAAGLIKARRDGRNIIYAADYGGIRGLVDFLMSECCQGDPRLCGPYVVNTENRNETPACALQG
jgi:DNA-binding transcriptional ArsR family regulator